MSSVRNSMAEREKEAEIRGFDEGRCEADDRDRERNPGISGDFRRFSSPNHSKM